MTDPNYLEYGALGVLAATIAAGFTLARAVALPLLKDILATNRDLRDMARALREAMVSMGQRLEGLNHRVEDVGDQVDDVHYELCGTKRGSPRRKKDGDGERE